MDTSSPEPFRTNPETNQQLASWFKEQSLELLAESLSQMNYPGYPDQIYRLWSDGVCKLQKPLVLPRGPSETSKGERPSIPTSQALSRQGIELEADGRPLHPWFHEMIKHPGIGVLTGKGFYWNWGPNYTADPIVLRHDLDEPHVLLIERGDGSGWALPVGFKNAGESDIDAAFREALEETGIDITAFSHKTNQVYKGPVADLRVTANAWPETGAFRIDLDLNSRVDYRDLAEMTRKSTQGKLLRKLCNLAMPRYYSGVPWQGRDDAKSAAWIPVSRARQNLFGSHKLLILLALGQAPTLSVEKG